MAIIMRSSGQKRDDGDKRKQLYTWVGCGLVAVLTLISVIPNSSKEPKAPSYGQFSSKMQDLASMPFGTDADASSFLKNNSEYSEISNENLLGSLFSTEDRKERQAKDKAEGVPPPADPEYKEIEKQKAQAQKNEQVKESRKQKQIREQETYKKGKENIKKKNEQTYSQQNRTSRATLNSGGSRGGSSSGASTGVTGSIWRADNQNVKHGTTFNEKHTAAAQDIAFAKQYGRNVGLDVATIESMKGANASDAEGAAAGAIDAFQGEVSAEDLEKDEKELGLDELPTGLNEDLQNDLQRQLSEDVNKQEHENAKSSNTAKGYSVNENCMDSNGTLVKSCLKTKFWNDFWTNLAKSGIDCITSGCWTNWIKDKDEGVGIIALGDKGYATQNTDGTWTVKEWGN